MYTFSLHGIFKNSPTCQLVAHVYKWFILQNNKNEHSLIFIFCTWVFVVCHRYLLLFDIDHLFISLDYQFLLYQISSDLNAPKKGRPINITNDLVHLSLMEIYVLINENAFKNNFSEDLFLSVFFKSLKFIKNKISAKHILKIDNFPDKKI